MRKCKHEDMKTSDTKDQAAGPFDSGTETPGAVIDPEDGLFQAMEELKKKLGPKKFIELLMREIPLRK